MILCRSAHHRGGLQLRLTGFIEPCLPSPAPNPPAGDGWIHEIKLDGFRMLARRDGAGVRLLTRRGIDWTTPAIGCTPRLIDQSKDRPRSRQDNNGSAISRAIEVSIYRFEFIAIAQPSVLNSYPNADLL